MAEPTHNRWVILGGGSAGWIAAAALAHQFRGTLDITLVESSEIGTIGVGEAVIPPFLTFIRSLGIDEQQFISRVAGSFKLGIEFVDWRRPGHNYFHPFGELGKPLDGHDFYHLWRKAVQQGETFGLMDFSPAATMARAGKFFLPFKLPSQSAFAGANYALHFDAALVARELRRFAEARGVKRIDAKVERVQQDATGRITCLQLNNDQQLAGDFFIDCSGFSGLLIHKTLGAGFEDWSDYLPCNKAVAVQSRHTGQTPPYTVARAQAAGWSWRIPLQHRMGNGYVYCDKFLSDDQAIASLSTQLQGEALHEPRLISFTTGLRPELWKHNCIALGLAGGFLEPLESTAIHLVTRGVQFLLELFPQAALAPAQLCCLAREFNRRMRADYQEIRDFLVLHYCRTERDDTPFWAHCKHMAIPDSLQEKIALFEARGQLQPGNDDLFKKTNWQAVFEGMGVRASHYNPLVDLTDYAQLRDALMAGREHLARSVAELPDHDTFLRNFCPSAEPIKH